MSIEKALFTCCKARRETGTTGLGYYSVTAGMDAVRRSSQQISLMSSSYSAPRNQELWWSSAADEKTRDAEEKAAIKQHHPEAFTYRLIEEDGIEKAVFSFGKNLGRDVHGFRPGNILVSTVVCDPDDVEGYPFEYFGSKEIFTDLDREFFVNAPDEPAADLDAPESLEKGGRVTREDAEQFISEDPQRSELLMMMLQFLLDYNDPGQVTRQVMICDRMENIIYWTAALSLIFPKEIAQKFSFCTYSFLGTPDSGTVNLEPTMLCGVYSPSVNGDPEDRRATNYDFEFEAERIESALFDFEHGFFTESEPRCGYFAMMLKSALMNGFSGLEDYHRFLIDRTSYRSIDNDFARGSSVYLILRFRNQMSLNYLADAADFAEKYMDADALGELFDTAFGCTAGQGIMSSAFGDISELAVKCIDCGAKDKSEIYDLLLSFLKGGFTAQTLSRDEYLEAKGCIKSIFERCGDSFETCFAQALDSEDLRNELPGVTKKWVLLELAEILSRKAAAEGREGICGDSSDAQLFREAVTRALGSEEKERSALIRVFGDMFPENERRYFAQALAAESKGGTALYDDVIGYMAEQFADGCTDMAAAAAESGVKQQFFSACAARLVNGGSYETAALRCRELLSESLDGAYNDRADEMTDLLIALSEDDDADKAAANVYSAIETAERAGDDSDKAKKAVCEAFCQTLKRHGKWYSPGEAAAEMCISLAEQCGRDMFTEDSIMRNVLIMCEAAVGASGGKTPLALDISAIEKDELSGVSAALAESMVKRAADGGCMLDIPAYIDPESVPHPGPEEETLIRAFRGILKTQSGDRRAELAAQTAVRLAVCGRVNFRRLGEDMYDNKLRPDDLSEYLEDKQIYTYLKEHGKTVSELKRISEELSGGYSEKRGGGVFGKIRSRFGKGKNG